MQPDLKDITSLPKTWKNLETFEGSVEIAEKKIYLNGFCSTNGNSKVVGSAAQLYTQPKLRAYFELLERVGIIEAEKDNSASFSIFDGDKKLLEQLPQSKVFPISTLPKTWQYAKSNGVALGSSFKKASLSSGLELTERDRVLRFWYNQKSPEILQNSIDSKHLNLLGEVLTCDFSVDSSSNEPTVIGIFLFPKDENKPYICGFGCSHEHVTALNKAYNEVLQRLGFLWNEENQATEPEFSPTAMFHQEYFLHKSRFNKIYYWLTSDSVGECLLPLETKFSDIRYAEITPKYLKKDFFLVKAISDTHLPLIFGKHSPDTRIDIDLLVHPIS